MAILGHADMMKQHEQMIKDCAKQLNKGADINGTMIPTKDSGNVKNLGINAPYYMGMMQGD